MTGVASGFTTANAMSAAAIAGGIFVSNLAGGMASRQGYSPNVVDVIVGAAGLVLVGVASGPVRHAGLTLTGVSFFRLASRNFLPAAA